MKPLAVYIEEKGTTLDQLVAASGLDVKLVKRLWRGTIRRVRRSGKDWRQSSVLRSSRLPGTIPFRFSTFAATAHNPGGQPELLLSGLKFLQVMLTITLCQQVPVVGV